jgi:hypothetical protein
MTYTEKRIVENYSGLFEGLSSDSKIELIKSLSKSLKSEKKAVDNAFYKSFGAFASEKTPKQLVEEIKASGKFRKKKLNSDEVFA